MSISDLYSRLIAEFIGTAALVFFGTGAVAVSAETGAFDHTGIAFAFGAVVMIMIYAVGNVSGAHLNPAVTFAFAINKKIRYNTALLYVLVQFLAAAGASLLVKILLSADTVGMTLPRNGEALSAFVLESIFTFVLVFVILNVATGYKEKGIMAGAAIGITVFLLALVGGPYTGASMNPARSFGPALVSGNWNHFWVYLAGPFLGAMAAVPFCIMLQREQCENK